jgi:hypothetical protein
MSGFCGTVGTDLSTALRSHRNTAAALSVLVSQWPVSQVDLWYSFAMVILI